MEQRLRNCTGRPWLSTMENTIPLEHLPLSKLTVGGHFSDTSAVDSSRRERDSESSPRLVDIYSFMYEMISLYFPFENQPLISSHVQVEKLVIDGERSHRVRSCDLWM